MTGLPLNDVMCSVQCEYAVLLRFLSGLSWLYIGPGSLRVSGNLSVQLLNIVYDAIAVHSGSVERRSHACLVEAIMYSKPGPSRRPSPQCQLLLTIFSTASLAFLPFPWLFTLALSAVIAPQPAIRPEMDVRPRTFLIVLIGSYKCVARGNSLVTRRLSTHEAGRQQGREAKTPRQNSQYKEILIAGSQAERKGTAIHAHSTSSDDGREDMHAQDVSLDFVMW